MTLDTPYRAIFCDLFTDQTIDILPLRDVSFDDYIGRAGSLSGTVPVPDRDIADRVRKIQAGRTTVYLERGGDLWWGGIIWTTTLQSSGRGVLTMGIQASTFDSYATRRRIRTDVTYATPTDQLAIARGLWSAVQAGLGNSGITIGDETSGVLRTAKWRLGDETVYQEALDQLAAQENGFEQQILVYRDPVSGKRVRRLRLGHPKIRTGATDLIFDRPGAILSYSFPDDATRGGTTALARGASANNNAAAESRPTMSAEKVNSDLINGGWPLIDLTSDHNEVSDISTLNSLAAANLAKAAGSVLIPQINIRLGGIVPPALLGRTARIRITDEWHPQGLDRRYRVIGVKVGPPERGRPDTAELYLEEA